MSLIAAVALVGAIESFPFRGGGTPSPERRNAATSPAERPAPTAPRPLIDVERPSSSGLAGTEVADTAQVTVDLQARPREVADSGGRKAATRGDRAVRPRTSDSRAKGGPRTTTGGGVPVRLDPALEGRTVIPIDAPDRTAGSDDEPTVDPDPRLGPGLWAATWSEVPGDFDWLTPMVWIRGNGVADTSWTSDRYFLPEVVAAELATRPEGRRVLFPWRYRHSLIDHPMDRLRSGDGSTLQIQGPFVDAGAMSIETEWTPFVDRLAALGASPDHLILDIESAGAFKSWNLDVDTIGAILDDPRFESTDLGTSITPASMAGDWTASQIKSGDPIRATTDFNATIDRLFTRALDASILEPALAHWPDLTASNYGGIRVSPEQSTPDMNGVHVWGDGRFGSHSALDLYGRLRNLCSYFGPDPSDPTRIVRTNRGRFEPSGWLGLQVDVNRARALWRTDPSPFHAWIATPDWRSDGISTSYYQNSPYWKENVFQQALAGASLILFWNPQRTEVESPAETEARVENARRLEEVLAELDSKTLGATPLMPLDSARLDWTSDVLLGGASLPDGRRLWRLTVAPDVEGVAVKVGDRRRMLRVGEQPGFWLTGGPDDAIEVLRIERK